MSRSLHEALEAADQAPRPPAATRRKQRSVVCGVDCFGDASTVVDVAQRLAGRLNSRLVLAHVADPARPISHPLGSVHPLDAPAWPQEVAADSGRGLLRLISHGSGLGSADTRVEVSDPVTGLLAITREENSEMLVVGFGGEHPFRLVGQAGVLRPDDVPCPVVVVPPGEGNEQFRVRLAGTSILCGLDGSAEAFRAGILAGDLSARTGGRLVLAHVCEESSESPREALARERGGGAAQARLIDAVGDLVHDSVDVTSRVVFGAPAAELASLASSERCWLVVIGSRGQHDTPAVVGSVAAYMAESAPVPVVMLSKQAEVLPGTGHYELSEVV
jgi:nucleotide-binding universal stress UspA family protein